MTDMTSSSLSHVRFAFRLPRFAVRGLGGKIDRLSEALSHAHLMVFVAPYVGRSPKARISEGYEAGRDPSW